VIKCECCMPTSVPQTPGRCSITTAYSKRWKQQGLQNPQGAYQGGGGEQGEEVDCGRLGRLVAKKQHFKSFSMGTSSSIFSFISSIMMSPSSSWSALRLSQLSPCKQLHASSHAASSGSISTSTSTSRRF